MRAKVARLASSTQGCSEGTTVVSLRRNADNSVLDDVTITVTSPPPPPTPTPTPAVRFSLSSYSVDEGAPQPQPIEVRLSRASGQNLDIPITVSGGTDTDSGDYSVDGLNSGKLRINSGDTSETFTIRANQDTGCNNETVNLGFGTPPSGVGLGSPSNATLTIDDDDPCPPTNLEIRYLETSTTSLVVSYTHSASTERFYQFELHRSLTAGGGYAPLPPSERVNVIVADAVFHDLDAMHWYKAKGRTCETESRTGCGEWSDESAAFFFDAPPTITSVAVDPDDADRLMVNYTGATSQTGYFRFQILRSATQGGSHDVVYTVDDALATDGVEFDGLDHSRWYQFSAKSCHAGWDNCPDWSGYTDKVFLLAKPVLDVEPLPLRKAKLSWDPVAVPSTHTAEYDLEIQEAGGGWSFLRTEILTDASLEIDLDDIMFGDGLAHNPKYEVRVKARQKGNGGAADGMDGGYSDTITIIDNPILTGGRASGNSPGGSGQATLEWTRIPGATEYIVEYRKLGERNTYEGVPGLDHTSLSWPGQFDWPYYEQQSSSPDRFSPNGSNPQSRTIAGLDLGELYAFQVNYRTNAGMVFSARDAYVWASSQLPENNKRVATYPYFGYHNNRVFEYIICDTTFPDPRWVDIIDGAFMEWQEATGGLITVSNVGGNCPVAAHGSDPTRDFIVQDDAQNEIRMFNATSSSSIHAFPEFKSDAFKACLAPNVLACVSSFHGYSGIQIQEQDPLERIRIANLVASHDPRVLGELLNVLDHPRQARNIIQSVDVSFNESELLNPGDQPTNVEFNTCFDAIGITADSNHRGHEIAVHEAGHALGMSSFSIRDLLAGTASELFDFLPWIAPTDEQRYQTAHPTIPDSAMNYDRNVWQGSEEPDCSPHPFDIMAITALYQSVPAVSILGPFSGLVGSAFALTAQASGGVLPYTYEWSSPNEAFVFLPDARSSTVLINPPPVPPGDPFSISDVKLVVRDSNGTEAHATKLSTTFP